MKQLFRSRRFVWEHETPSSRVLRFLTRITREKRLTQSHIRSVVDRLLHRLCVSPQGMGPVRRALDLYRSPPDGWWFKGVSPFQQFFELQIEAQLQYRRAERECKQHRNPVTLDLQDKLHARDLAKKIRDERGPSPKSVSAKKWIGAMPDNWVVSTALQLPMGTKVPQDVIELKREELRMRRLAKEVKHLINQRKLNAPVTEHP